MPQSASSLEPRLKTSELNAPGSWASFSAVSSAAAGSGGEGGIEGGPADGLVAPGLLELEAASAEPPACSCSSRCAAFNLQLEGGLEDLLPVLIELTKPLRRSAIVRSRPSLPLPNLPLDSPLVPREEASERMKLGVVNRLPRTSPMAARFCCNVRTANAYLRTHRGVNAVLKV